MVRSTREIKGISKYDNIIQKNNKRIIKEIIRVVGKLGAKNSTSSI